MYWETYPLDDGLNIIDGDDCAFNTTECLRGVPEKSKDLKLVPGFEPFIQWVPGVNIFVSLAKHGSSYQEDKLRRFNLLGEGKGQFSPANVYICSLEKEKKLFIEKIIKRAKEICPSCPVRVWGDRIDLELEEGKRNGAITIQVRLKEGKYANRAPKNSYQVPDFVVCDWFEAQRLPIFRFVSERMVARRA